MNYSGREFAAIDQAYLEKFGPLPEGLLRRAASEGYSDELGAAMKEAVDSGQKPDWSGYANRQNELLRVSAAAETRRPSGTNVHR